MRRGRGSRLWLSLIATTLLLVALALHLGWAAKPGRWPIATGWERIPTHLRPEITSRPWPISTDPEATPQIQWLGHSGFVVTWHGTRLLLDPNTSRWCTIARRVLEPTLDLAQLGPIDAVLISHAHFDHLDLPTLRQIENDPQIVIPAGSEELVRLPATHRSPLIGLHPWQSHTVGSLEVIAVPARHNGGRLHPLKSHRLALGYVVRAGDDAFYFAGDTGAGNSFAEIRERYRPRLALLPIGAFAPRWPIGRVHLSPEQAVEVAQVLAVEVVMPMHFGTFALALDRPASALPRFARAAKLGKVHWLMPPLLRPGTNSASHGLSNPAEVD